MDPPHLLPLGLLLLALAAPHPNIAMSIVGTAEGIEDYPTEVTVYNCRDCKWCICESSKNNSEKLKEIANIHNKQCSSGIRDLETNKTHITVCFEKPDFCLEGFYGISWKRDGGSGLSCGTLNSGENASSDTSTEKKTICCEAETETKEYMPDLKCYYAHQSHPKLTTQPACISGNPEAPTSKRNRIFIFFPILFVAVCTMCYLFWLRRCTQGRRRHRPVPRRENIPLNG